MYVCTYVYTYVCTHLCGFRKMFKVVIQRKISHNYLVIMMFVIPKYSQHSNGCYTFQDVLFFLRARHVWPKHLETNTNIVLLCFV